MPRKRNSDKEPQAETSIPVAEPVAADVPEAAVAEANPDGQSFAEKIGQKSRMRVPDPFGIAADYLAGVKLFESKQDRQMAIKFGEGRPEDKPNQAVIDKLKEAGYKWNPSDRIWAHPVRGDTAMSTRIDAEKLYQEVSQMLRKEKGIEVGQEAAPF